MLIYITGQYTPEITLSIRQTCFCTQNSVGVHFFYSIFYCAIDNLCEVISVVIDTHPTKRRCYTSRATVVVNCQSAPVIQFWCRVLHLGLVVNIDPIYLRAIENKRAT